MAFRDSLPAEGMTWDKMDSVVGVYRVTHKNEARWCAQWREPDPANPDRTMSDIDWFKHFAVDIIDLEEQYESMKEHDITKLLDALTATVLALCPDAPQQLREAIRTVAVQHLKND